MFYSKNLEISFAQNYLILGIWQNWSYIFPIFLRFCTDFLSEQQKEKENPINIVGSESAQTGPSPLTNYARPRPRLRICRDP